MMELGTFRCGVKGDHLFRAVTRLQVNSAALEEVIYFLFWSNEQKCTMNWNHRPDGRPASTSTVEVGFS